MSLSGDAPPFDPDDAASREFSKARKGFDPTEVRVHLTKLTEEIKRLRATEADLRAQLEDAATRVPDVESLDPAAISRALGAETVRIIDTAREASDEIRAKAEENAGRVVRDAHERANRLTRDAAELRETAAREAEELTSSARADADALLAESRAEAEATRSDAAAEAASIREEAALILDERTTEAQLEAVRIRGEAEAARAEAEAYAAQRRADADREAAATAERAVADAEAEVESARERGREMIREAKEARERMIRDLAERRHNSRQQLEALRAGRERLIEAFATAREALDEATDELVESLPSARAAADAAARSVDEDLDAAVLELDTLIDRGADTDELIDGSVDPIDRPLEVPAETGDAQPGEPPVEPVGEVESDELIDELDDDEDEDEDEPADGEAAAMIDIALDAADDDDDDVGAADEAADVLVLESVPAGFDVVDMDVEGTVETDDDDDDDDDDFDDDDDDDDFDDDDDEDEDEDGDDAEIPQRGRLRLVSSNEGGPSPVGIEALVDATPVAESAEEPRSAEVEELFARLRADRSAVDDDDDFDDDDDEDDEDEDDDAPSAEVTTLSTGAVVIDLSAVEAERSVAGGTDVTDVTDDIDLLDDAGAAAQQAMLDQRDALLGDVAQALGRRVRRVVTDQENEVLDLVRRNRKLKGSDDLLPSRDTQIEAYRAAIHKDLREVLAAGADFLAIGNELDDSVVEAALDELLAAVGEWGIDPLRAKLARVVDDSDDTSPDRNELVDRLRATYREWRNDRIGELSGDIATLGFSRGVMAAASPDQQLCWMVDHGGLPCPDGEDNQLAGPVTVGHEFPTGDICPPAHPGCRCLLVPVP